MSGEISFQELVGRVSEAVGRIEALEKAVIELRRPPEVAYRFPPEEASLIAKEFSGVIKSLSEAVSKLSEKGIGIETKFSSKDGLLTVQLFKYVEPQKKGEG